MLSENEVLLFFFSVGLRERIHMVKMLNIFKYALDHILGPKSDGYHEKIPVVSFVGFSLQLKLKLSGPFIVNFLLDAIHLEINNDVGHVLEGAQLGILANELEALKPILLAGLVVNEA